MRNSKAICGVCGEASCVEVLSLPSYPAYLMPVPPALANRVVTPPLVLAGCGTCGHLQLSDVDPEVQRLIYEVYYSYYVFDSAEALVPFYRKPFDTFVEDLAAAKLLPHGNLLEIGCSSGERVPLFERFSATYTGVDPSDRIALAKERFPQHRFVKGYFPQDLPSGSFEVVATQFNLEHLSDPAGFVSAIRQSATADTVLLIQIPDAGFYQRTNQPNFLAHEHLHYFRRSQLERLLRRHAFEAFAWGAEGPSLICAARPSTTSRPVDAPEDDALEWAHTQKRIFDTRPILPPGPLTFYGVGPLLFWLLLDIDRHREIYVVDDNPRYEGQALPGYGYPIRRADRALLERAPTVVLSLNVIYHAAVMERLRGLGVPYNVHRIDGQGWSQEKN
jgi:2-polyprenyl-3-methyl-5-hydroxy-6-metoxy-1,4-benzoquinol methylase